MTHTGRGAHRAVLLHGFTGSSDDWGAGLLAGLTGFGISSQPVDLPGHGRHRGVVDPARYTLDATLASIDHALAGRAALIGYSMGGRIALHYAIRYPDRVSRLVLESASPGLATGRERSDRRRADSALAEAIEEEGIEWFVERWSALPLFDTQKALDARTLGAVRERRLLNDPASLAAALRGLGTGVLPSAWDRLAGLRVPTLLLTGARDEKFVGIAERMSARIPDCRHVSVRGAGHRVHLEAPEPWVVHVSTFLTAP